MTVWTVTATVAVEEVLPLDDDPGVLPTVGGASTGVVTFVVVLR